MMSEINAYSDADDSSSIITMESEGLEIGYTAVQTQIPDIPAISQITSVSFRSCTDITIGTTTSYNGPITFNQYGYERPTNNLGKKMVTFFKRWKILLTIIIVLVSVLVATGLILHFNNDKADTGIINIDNDNTTLRLVSREEWRAKPVTGHIPDLITPVPFVIIQHTDGPSCDSLATCTTLVRQVQLLHNSSKNIEDDVGYNFLIGGDGAAYEGRGWNKLGAHAYGYNTRSIGIGFIGDFRQENPTDQQIVALLKLLHDGVKMNKISENYTLLGANQVRQTESPGKMLFRILTKLPHWSDQID